MPPTGNGSSISDRARSSSAVDPQDGLFDKTFDDDTLEAALEERERLRQQKLEAQRAAKVADDAAKNELARFELAVGEVARVGRFRIKKTQPQGRDVSFTTNPSPRLNIGVIADGE
jgi:hypothetical protein